MSEDRAQRVVTTITREEGLMDRIEMGERKRAVMIAAATRWERAAPRVAETAHRLAVGGTEAAADTVRLAKYLARESRKRGRVGFERIIGGTVELDDMPPTPTARAAGKPVARIVELFDKRRIGDGFATGFLVAPGLLITNWHVFASARDATGCGAQFGYELGEDRNLQPGVVFEIDADQFFFADEQLDLAIVGVKRAPTIGNSDLKGWGAVLLIPSPGKILVGQPISIIQHPDGRYKHWAVRQNKLYFEPRDSDLFLSYTTDTLPGSSGSPAFNNDWELVALHHSGVPRTQNGEIMTIMKTVWKSGMPDSHIDWVANEGARVSKICERLREYPVSNPHHESTINQLIGTIGDPIMEEGTSRVGTTGASASIPSVPEQGGHPTFNIVVNGTANFNINGGAPATTDVTARTLQLVGREAPAVALEKKLRFDPDYRRRPGYVSTFLGKFDVPPPIGAT